MNYDALDVPETYVERSPRSDDLEEAFYAEEACQLLRTNQQLKSNFPPQMEDVGI